MQSNHNPVYRVTSQGDVIPLSPTQNLSDVPVSLKALSEFAQTHVHSIATLCAEQVCDRRDGERQAKEDSRANHRNLNRLLTLIGAVVISCVVTTVLDPYWHLGIVSEHIVKVYGPYTFLITIVMDSCLAIYGMIRKY